MNIQKWVKEWIHALRVAFYFRKFRKLNPGAVSIYLYAVEPHEANILNRMVEQNGGSPSTAFMNVVTVGFQAYEQILNIDDEIVHSAGCSDCGGDCKHEYVNYIG